MQTVSIESSPGLQAWKALYRRAEQAARAFFAEHFGDVCAACFAAAEARGHPAFCCCRRTNFIPDLIADPMLGDLAEESLGRSLLAEATRRYSSDCAALGPHGCRIPFGRPGACNSYQCEHLYRCQQAVMDAAAMARLTDVLDVFLILADADERRAQGYSACLRQVERLEAELEAAAQRLRQHADAFARRKAQVMAEMLPAGTAGSQQV